MTHYDVVVVGAGPTGLTLANLLRVYGIRALLVERNAATVGEPRAVSIDDESLRTMQAAGVSEPVLASIVAGYGSEYYTRSGRLFLRVEPTAQPYGYPRRNAFRQPTLEAQLREALADSPTITALFSCTLRGFTQDEHGVRLELASAEEAPCIVHCDYLVGCDGAASAVRAALGAEFSGKTFEDRWLIIDLENSPVPSRHTQVFCDSRRPCIALPGPGNTRRFEFKVHAHETAEQMLHPEMISALLKRYGATPGSTLRRKVVYTFHARVADRWADRRVFLAGDAAHLTPPFAGQGMNSGIRDAHNLAWKLAAVVGGRLGPGLLGSYEIERREHVMDMIRLALRMGRVMAPSNTCFAWLTQSAFRALGLWPRVRDYFGQMKYKPKPRFARGFLIPDALHAKRTLVGRLLPQPIVTRRDAARVLLDDVLGPGFAVLCHASDAHAVHQLVRDRTWSALDARCVAVAAAGDSCQPDMNIELVIDDEGTLVDAFTQYRGRALLVRPDRYVAAAFDLSEPDRALQSLQRLILATWPDGTQTRVCAFGPMRDAT